MRIPIILIVLLILSAASAAEAQSEVYTYVDEDGVVHFTDMPKAGAKSFLLGDRVMNVRARGFYKGSLTRAVPYADLFNQAAERYGLDAELLAAIAQVESSFNPKAVSNKGAKGVMQLIDSTAAAYGVTDVFDPAQNIDGGSRHMRDLLAAFNGDLTLALAAYNAGRTAVNRYGGVPPYSETRRYLKKISDIYGDLDSEISSSQIVSSFAVARAVRDGKTAVYRFYTESGVNYSDNPPIGKPYEEVKLRY